MSIEFLGDQPWRGEEGAPRTGYGLLFRVNGHDVTIWLTTEITMNLDRTGERGRSQEAAELFIKMQLENGWDPKVQSSLIFNEPALQNWVRHRPEWKAKAAGK